jgi:hypothetical protein
MTTPGLRIRHLAFHGPNREPASIEFGAGLNLIYGASDTGKSFVVEAIDFMLGGKTTLRDIPERVGMIACSSASKPSKASNSRFRGVQMVAISDCSRAFIWNLRRLLPKPANCRSTQRSQLGQPVKLLT